MDFSFTEEQQAIRQAVREICRNYPDKYWRDLDRTEGYPDAFVQDLTQAGWLAALIPEEYGGAGFDTEADVERKFRETRLWSIAPINNNLVLAYVGQHVLGLPRSY